MKKSKFRRFWEWYVLGHYHCDRCPYSWNDAFPGCEDCDCGCVIFGDIRDTCRLLPPFRFLIGWGKKKRFQYAQVHEYDDMAAWYQSQERNAPAMAAAITQCMERWNLNFHHPMPDGSQVPVEDQKSEIEAVAYWVADEYEREIHPPKHLRLRDEWALLMKKTWKQFVRSFAPYFTNSRNIPKRF